MHATSWTCHSCIACSMTDHAVELLLLQEALHYFALHAVLHPHTLLTMCKLADDIDASAAQEAAGRAAGEESV